MKDGIKETKDINKDKAQTCEATVEEAMQDPREISDETLEGIAGGIIPIIDAF